MNLTQQPFDKEAFLSALNEFPLVLIDLIVTVQELPSALTELISALTELISALTEDSLNLIDSLLETINHNR